MNEFIETVVVLPEKEGKKRTEVGPAVRVKEILLQRYVMIILY